MSRYTPEPWDKEAIYWLFRYARKHEGPWDDESLCPDSNKTNFPDENDATLIAAAPELLEACELALVSDDRAVEGFLRAAIAKAKGEQE